MAAVSHFLRVLSSSPPVFYLYSSFPTHVIDGFKKLHKNFYGVSQMRNLCFIC